MLKVSTVGFDRRTLFYWLLTTDYCLLLFLTAVRRAC